MYSINGWNVSVERVTALMGVKELPPTTCYLKVFRYPQGFGHPKEVCDSCNGQEFSHPDDAFEAARDHGHLAG